MSKLAALQEPLLGRVINVHTDSPRVFKFLWEIEAASQRRRGVRPEEEPKKPARKSKARKEKTPAESAEETNDRKTDQ